MIVFPPRRPTAVWPFLALNRWPSAKNLTGYFPVDCQRQSGSDNLSETYRDFLTAMQPVLVVDITLVVSMVVLPKLLPRTKKT
jgi:hypothetical protein